MESVHAFLEEHAEQLKDGKATPEQVKEMVNELLEMSASEEREFKSRLKQLYLHMLKYQTQIDKQTRSWIESILHQSDDLIDFVKDKSLVRRILPEIPTIFDRARRLAIKETCLPDRAFIKEVPADWTLENLTNDSFIDSFLDKYATTSEAKFYLFKY